MLLVVRVPEEAVASWFCFDDSWFCFDDSCCAVCSMELDCKSPKVPPG